jgi:hypothetical protein
MCPEVRDNIDEFIINRGSSGSLDSMCKDDCIPGIQTATEKKKLLGRFGFRNEFDTVSFACVWSI